MYMIFYFYFLHVRDRHFPVTAGVENASVGGKQILMQRAMWWKLYSNVIDLFILDWSGQQFNIITSPKDRVTRFKITNNQSYFTPANDTIMCAVYSCFAWWIPSFSHSFSHSHSVPSFTFSPQTNRCKMKPRMLLGSWMRFSRLPRL